MIWLPGLEVDPVKLICLNEPTSVGTDAPDVRLMFNLFEAVAPPEKPKLKDLVTDIAAETLDVPVNVKFVAVTIDRFVAPTDAASTIEPVEPQAIARVFVLLELRILVVRVKLFKSSVPSVKVHVAEPEPRSVVKASCRVVVIPVPLTVNVSITSPFDVSVPVPTVVKSVLVYVPPDANVNP